MKYNKLDGWSNKNLFSYESGNWKSKVKVLAIWFLQGPLSLACRWPLSWCALTGLYSFMYIPVSPSVSNFLFKSTPVKWDGLRFTLRALFERNDLFKVPVSKCSDFLK